MDKKMTHLSGETVHLPKANQQPCFMIREGCENMSTWRMETEFLLLHFCDKCKNKGLFKDKDPTWVKLD